MSQPPGQTIFDVVYGSHAHGTNTPTSDVDRRGVYLLPNDDFLGLGRPQTTWEHKPSDTVFWELGHFVSLLVKGNPNIVGMLYVPEDSVTLCSPVMDQVMAMRDRFLSQNFRSAYMGWIWRESRDIGALHKGNAKRLSHLPRLMWELTSVYETGTMVVRPDDEKRQTIIDIKTGVIDYPDAAAMVGSMLLDLQALDAEAGPSLPEAPIVEANATLLAIRFGTPHT